MSGDRHLTVRVDAMTAKVLLAISPIVASFTLIWLRNYHRDIFNGFFWEDGLFEYLTSGVHLLAAVLAGSTARAFWNAKRTLLAWAYVGLTFGMFFIAGEEISWGQRILDIDTPAAIVQHNTQNELTVHNLEPVQRVLHWLYVVVGGYGSFVWLLRRGFGFLPTSLTKYLFPGWYLAPYFVPAMALYAHLELATRETAWFRYRSPDQEPVEVILAFGFLLFVVCSYYRQTLERATKQNKLFQVAWPIER